MKFKNKSEISETLEGVLSVELNAILEDVSKGLLASGERYQIVNWKTCVSLKSGKFDSMSEAATAIESLNESSDYLVVKV